MALVIRIWLYQSRSAGSYELEILQECAYVLVQLIAVKQCQEGLKCTCINISSLSPLHCLTLFDICMVNANQAQIPEKSVYFFNSLMPPALCMC